ncbi:Exonuclease SbcC [Pseudomonas sp. OF001]|nr:Exonuclease SbcC [Pseudomonas sp. OF001]
MHRSRRGRGDRPPEHPAGHLPGHAACGRGAAHPAAAGADRRQSLPEAPGAQRAGGRRRRQGAGDRRRLDPRQGQPRPRDGRTGCPLSWLRHGRAQGLSDAGASRGAQAPGADAHSSALLCAGPGAARSVLS